MIRAIGQKLQSRGSEILTGIVVVFFYFFILLHYKNPSAIYNDAGFTYLQFMQYSMSEDGSFLYQYPAKEVDPTGQMIPYQLPWISRVGDGFSLQYAPWFYLTVSPFYKIFHDSGFYIFNIFLFIATLFVGFKIVRELGGGSLAASIALILIGFGTTAPLYTLFFSEYTLAWSMASLAVWMAIKFMTDDKSRALPALFGLFAGIGTAYRLELIIPLLVVGFSIAFRGKRLNWTASSLALLFFLMPMLIFAAGNYIIQGHPLGLRFTNNVVTSEANTMAQKFAAVWAMIYKKKMGLAKQSLWMFTVIPGLIWMRRQLDFRSLLPYIWFIGTVLLLLFTIPNQGSHFSPRYLLGLYVPMAASAGILLENLWKERNQTNRGRKIAIISYSITIAVSIILSFFAYTGRLKWILISDEIVSQANEQIEKFSEHNLIFTEYASPQNLQYSSVTHSIFVVDSAQKFQMFKNYLTTIGENHFSVAIPLIVGHQNDPNIPGTRSIDPASVIPLKPDRVDTGYPYTIYHYTVVK